MMINGTPSVQQQATDLNVWLLLTLWQHVVTVQSLSSHEISAISLNSDIFFFLIFFSWRNPLILFVWSDSEVCYFFSNYAQNI